MTYKLTKLAFSPFALLEVTSGSGAAQWNKRNAAWVSSTNTWSGDALMFGCPSMTDAGIFVGCFAFSTSGTDRKQFAQQYEDQAAARSSSDDAMISYGSTAAYGAVSGSTTGSGWTIDHARARCVLMRTSA